MRSILLESENLLDAIFFLKKKATEVNLMGKKIKPVYKLIYFFSSKSINEFATISTN